MLLTARPVYYSLTEEGSSGDSAWPLWGLSVRMIYAVSRRPYLGLDYLDLISNLAHPDGFASRWRSMEPASGCCG